MPSRPTLITPPDSEMTPPSAANKSGVAYRSVAATSADQVNTDSSVDTAEFADAAAPATANRATTIASDPSLRSPPAIDHAPAQIASTASTIDGAMPRTSIGGIVITHAIAPRSTPAMPICFGDTARAGVTAMVPTLTSRRPWQIRSIRRSSRTALGRGGLLRGPAPERHADLSAALQQPERDHVGRHEQDDDPLDHERQVLDERRIDAQADVAIGGAGQERPEQHGGGDRAPGGVPTEQRHGDPVEADVRNLDVCREEVELPAEDVERGRDAGERATDQHHADPRAADVDPGITRRLRVEADRARLVAEPRAVNQQREHDRECERDEDPDVEPLK